MGLRVFGFLGFGVAGVKGFRWRVPEKTARFYMQRAVRTHMQKSSTREHELLQHQRRTFRIR